MMAPVFFRYMDGIKPYIIPVQYAKAGADYLVLVKNGSGNNILGDCRIHGRNDFSVYLIYGSFHGKEGIQPT